MERGKDDVDYIKNEGEREDGEPNTSSSVWIGARELSIGLGDDSRYWKWNYLHDTGGDVAELIGGWWLEIAGMIDTKRLTRKTSFGTYLVFKLTDHHRHLDRAIASVRSAKEKFEETAKKGYTVFISKTKKGENGTLRHLRSDGWMEIKLGEFFNNLGEDGEVEMRLMGTNALEWKSGLIVKGIDIRPNSSKSSLSVASAVLREDIVNLLDFIKRLKNEDLELELTFMTSCLQLCYYIRDDFDAEMSCISYDVHDLIQSLFHQSGDDMLVKLKYHVFPRLFENIMSFNISNHHSESSVIMTDDQLVELSDALLVNLHYLPKVRAKLAFQSMTQYEHLRNVFGNLRDFYGLIVNGFIERKTIEYILPQFHLMAESVGHFCFVLLPYQLDKDYILEVSQVNSKLANLLVEVIPFELEVMRICSTVLKDSKSAEVGLFTKQLVEACTDILRKSLIHLEQHTVNATTCSTLACNILADVPKDVIHHDELSVLLARTEALNKSVWIGARELSIAHGDSSWCWKWNYLHDAGVEVAELLNVCCLDIAGKIDTKRLTRKTSFGAYLVFKLTDSHTQLETTIASVRFAKEKIEETAKKGYTVFISETNKGENGTPEAS